MGGSIAGTEGGEYQAEEIEEDDWGMGGGDWEVGTDSFPMLTNSRREDFLFVLEWPLLCSADTPFSQAVAHFPSLLRLESRSR